jgi:hypothetical protein
MTPTSTQPTSPDCDGDCGCHHGYHQDNHCCECTGMTEGCFQPRGCALGCHEQMINNPTALAFSDLDGRTFGVRNIPEPFVSEAARNFVLQCRNGEIKRAFQSRRAS